MIKTNCFGKILEKLQNVLTTIFGISNYIILEKQKILGVLEPTTAFHENRDRHSEM